jgi:hypothetical protein
LPKKCFASNSIAKINNVWKYVSIYYFSGDEDNGSFTGEYTEVIPSIEATGNTDYPWQATWPAGQTVVRNGVVNDIIATNGQTVNRWKNKITATGSGSFIQPTLNSQPVLTSDGILFNSRSLNATFTSSSNINNVTYYIVAKRIGSTTTGRRIIGKSNNRELGFLANSNNTFAMKDLFQANIAGLTIPQDDNFYIYCIAFNEGDGSFFKGNTFAVEYVGTQRNFRTRNISLTLGDTNLINTTISKVLIYNGTHSAVERTAIMNYLYNNTPNSTLA